MSQKCGQCKYQWTFQISNFKPFFLALAMPPSTSFQRCSRGRTSYFLSRLVRSLLPVAPGYSPQAQEEDNDGNCQQSIFTACNYKNHAANQVPAHHFLHQFSLWKSSYPGYPRLPLCPHSLVHLLRALALACKRR